MVLRSCSNPRRFDAAGLGSAIPKCQGFPLLTHWNREWWTKQVPIPCRVLGSRMIRSLLYATHALSFFDEKTRKPEDPCVVFHLQRFLFNRRFDIYQLLYRAKWAPQPVEPSKSMDCPSALFVEIEAKPERMFRRVRPALSRRIRNPAFIIRHRCFCLCHHLKASSEGLLESKRQ
jgi:hypothetical protein